MSIVRLVLDDADTGEEMIFFFRRRRPYIFLRDRVTKRFIRILRQIEKRYFTVVEYDETRARKGNPIYVDCVLKTILKPEHIPQLTEVEDWMDKLSVEIIRRNFGRYVAYELLDLAGIEYGSTITCEEKYEEGRFYYEIVWKHHPEEKGKRKSGVITK